MKIDFEKCLKKTTDSIQGCENAGDMLKISQSILNIAHAQANYEETARKSTSPMDTVKSISLEANSAITDAVKSRTNQDIERPGVTKEIANWLAKFGS